MIRSIVNVGYDLYSHIFVDSWREGEKTSECLSWWAST